MQAETALPAENASSAAFLAPPLRKNENNSQIILAGYAVPSSSYHRMKNSATKIIVRFSADTEADRQRRTFALPCGGCPDLLPMLQSRLESLHCPIYNADCFGWDHAMTAELEQGNLQLKPAHGTNGQTRPQPFLTRQP
jgi:hypothetical protein